MWIVNRYTNNIWLKSTHPSQADALAARFATNRQQNRFSCFTVTVEIASNPAEVPSRLSSSCHRKLSSFPKARCAPMIHPVMRVARPIGAFALTAARRFWLSKTRTLTLSRSELRASMIRVGSTRKWMCGHQTRTHGTK